MYPILILRAEVVCLVILIFLLFTAKAYKLERDSKTFNRLLLFALIHVCFDIITIWTVNHTDTVPRIINDSCHVIFYLSAIMFSNELACYVVNICYHQNAKKLYALGHGLATLYLFSMNFLDIEYTPTLGSYASTGPAAYVGYGLAFLFFMTALVMMLRHMDLLTTPMKKALIPMMLVLIIVEICQIIVRSILFTGCAVTIVTVGFFFSLKNPVRVFQQKALTDALTGVRSRGSYEADIEKLDKKFRQAPNDEYTFAFCDLNGLRSVNNRYGHPEGDKYITLIATAITRCMKHASAVYRIGGDEFLVLYQHTTEGIVNQEISDLQTECQKTAEGRDYLPSVSVGYASSSANYKSLKDVIRNADYAMYQNKAQMKIFKTYESGAFGTRLNYTGLTDKIFDAMCTSNERNYPFITNMETNVTRISPAWRKYFGLPDEFYADFNSVWLERIHPDDRQGCLDDIAAVINGHQKYHNYSYLAKKSDGEYVRVSCHGAVYRDNTDSCAYFAGFMVNHGMDEATDALTGLRNFDQLTTEVCAHQDQGRSFAVLKLKLLNFARVNMLYGYDGGNEILRSIAIVLSEKMVNKGEVFCQSSVNFSILFEGSDKKAVEDYYAKISELLSEGVETEIGYVPIQLAGGALISNGRHQPIQDMRRGLVFALEESHYSCKNQLVFFQNQDPGSAGSDVSLLSEIHSDALTDMKFFQLRYQPIADIRTRRTVGAEALLRWRHPLLGEISPGRFISFLENDPCYYRLGLVILERAIKDAKTFRETIPGFKINVNITALQLQNDQFPDHVFEILNKYDYEPGGLVLELTERCKEMDSGFLSRKIADLRARGIQVAFDDLGTGYSTVSLLMDIPVDEIKLDMNFVRDLQNRESYQLFVSSLVLGSKSAMNHYTICFEGIEDADMLGFVGRFGDYLAQGYYFARPLLPDDFKAYITKQAREIEETIPSQPFDTLEDM